MLPQVTLLVAADRRGREMAYPLTDAHVAHIALDALEHSEEEL